jgi:hypothetical protein
MSHCCPPKIWDTQPACPWLAGAGHGAQLVPQVATLLSSEQTLLQL